MATKKATKSAKKGEPKAKATKKTTPKGKEGRGHKAEIPESTAAALKIDWRR